MKAIIKETGQEVEVVSRFMPKKRNAPGRAWVCILNDERIVDEDSLEYIDQKPKVEICPHSIKSKSYKENGYPIEACDNGLEQMVIGDLAAIKETTMMDKIIEEAFAEHFGFPLCDVQDIENLKHISSPGTTIESLMYQGQTFLYFDTHQDLDVRIVPGGGYEVKTELKYKKV